MARRAANQPPAPGSDLTPNYSSVFGKIILSKFDSMPEWVRVCAFLVALVVFVYVTLHSINTKYFVTGTLLESTAAHSHLQLARGYDVRWADNYAGTNSKGRYVIVLTPLEYVSLLKSGKHTLEIWKPGDKDNAQDSQVCSKTVSFQLMENAFNDFYIDGTCQTEAPVQQGRLNFTPPATAESLIPAVQAASTSASTPYHLLARSLRFDTRWPRSDSAQMILFQYDAQLPLLSLPGAPYGGVSTLPGSSLAFAFGTYMPSQALAGGRIRLSDKSSLFSYTEEWFDLPASMESGKEVVLKGTMGSDLALLPVGPSTLTIFGKRGDASHFNQLSEDLLKAGVFPVGAVSPLGPDIETNTLFFGPGVPPWTVKSVAAAVQKNGVEIRRIAYPYTFSSTPDLTRIQLGSTKACQAAPAVRPAEWAALAKVPDNQVQQFLARFHDCRKP